MAVWRELTPYCTDFSSEAGVGEAFRRAGTDRQEDGNARRAAVTVAAGDAGGRSMPASAFHPVGREKFPAGLFYIADSSYLRSHK